MKFFLISDTHDTAIGMRLAGIEGVVAEDESSAAKALAAACADPEIGIVLITERLSGICGGLVSDIKMTHSHPLIVEIPDRDGDGRASDSITKYVRESIGLKL